MLALNINDCTVHNINTFALSCYKSNSSKICAEVYYLIVTTHVVPWAERVKLARHHRNSSHSAAMRHWHAKQPSPALWQQMCRTVRTAEFVCNWYCWCCAICISWWHWEIVVSQSGGGGATVALCATYWKFVWGWMKPKVCAMRRPCVQ